MTVFNNLYKTYLEAEKAGLVDQTENLNLPGRPPVLLPIYHTDKKASNDKDIIEITLDENGDFLRARFLPKNFVIIFPITEESIKRTSGIAAHPLTEELSYVIPNFNEKKYDAYIDEVKNWYYWNTRNSTPLLLEAVYYYLKQNTLLNDLINYLFPQSKISIEKNRICLQKDEKIEVISQKCFITFKVECLKNADLTVSTDKQLHKNYIEYVQSKQDAQQQNYCNISGMKTYCTPHHRSIIGKAKIVSSQNPESFVGRFEDGDDVIKIGHDTSQKIHLMLKYLIDNPWTHRYLNNNSYMLSWSSDTIESPPVDIMKGQKFSQNEDSLYEMFNQLEIFNKQELSDFVIGDDISQNILDKLGGRLYLKEGTLINDHYYVLILNKINDGRISMKYYRNMHIHELSQRLSDWFATTNWTFYNYGKFYVASPSLEQMINYTFGNYDGKKMSVKKDKLMNQKLEQLIPCIIEGRRIPLDFVNKMKINVTNRTLYKNHWFIFISYACSILKKYKYDYKNERVKSTLQRENESRSYLFGRLAAVYEGIESTVTNNSRVTNIEKSWTRFMRYPEKTMLYLEEKMAPYLIKLKRENKYYHKYSKLLEEIMLKLNELNLTTNQKNYPVDEDFIFGYYAQRQALYNKNDPEEDSYGPANK